IVPPQDVDLASLGPSTGSGTASYGSGYTVTFNTYTASVNLGNGIVTAPTTVAVITSVAGDPAQAGEGRPIMGVGAGYAGYPPSPTPPSPLQALPGDLGQGVLFNNPAGVLQFGANPLTSYA